MFYVMSTMYPWVNDSLWPNDAISKVSGILVNIGSGISYSFDKCHAITWTNFN